MNSRCQKNSTNKLQKSGKTVFAAGATGRRVILPTSHQVLLLPCDFQAIAGNDLINWNSGPSVHRSILTYVHPSVHKMFLQFRSNLCVGRSQPDTCTSMTYTFTFDLRMLLLFELLWLPYGIRQTIIFSSSRLFFLLFFPRLISAAADCMSAILPHFDNRKKTC